nr:hypothetical protein CFP56_21558 [Quercus suber]
MAHQIYGAVLRSSRQGSPFRLHPHISITSIVRSSRGFSTTPRRQQEPSRPGDDDPDDLDEQLSDLQRHLSEHKNLLTTSAADQRTQKRLQAELDFLQTFQMLRTYALDAANMPDRANPDKRNDELFWQLRILWRTTADSLYHTLLAPSGEVPLLVRAKRLGGFVVISVITGLTYPLDWVIRRLP